MGGAVCVACAACMLQPFVCVSAKSDFGKAFEKAHREQGAGGRFSYGGREYSTNRADGRDLRAEASRASSSASSTPGSRSGSGGDGHRGSGGRSASVSHGSGVGSASVSRGSGGGSASQPWHTEQQPREHPQSRYSMAGQG